VLHTAGSASFVLHAATIFSRHVAVSGLRWTADGFPKACDHKYLFNYCLDRFNHRLDRFDHCLSEICSALGRINTLADWSTFKPAAGTVSDSHSHSRACIKSHTRSYPDTDAVSKCSAYAGAPSDSSTPPPIASLIGFEHLNESRRRFQFHKRSQQFIGAHNKALTIAVRVSDEDCTPGRIHDCNAAPTSTGFAEIASDDFRVLQFSL
jgi:hypothetical protein